MISAARFRPRRHQLPLGRDTAAWLLPWVFAVLAYIAGIAALGLLLMHDTLRASGTSLATHLTVQVPAEASDARLQTILAALRQTAGIRSVRQLTSAETAKLLEPWLGKPVPVDELPIPRVIDVETDPGEVIDLGKLREQLTSLVPDARLDDQRSSLTIVRTAAQPLRILLAALILAALLLTAVLAVFAMRTALATRQSVIDLLHLLGAADRDIARPLATRAARLALLGGGIGALAVLLTIAAFGDVSGIFAVPIARIAITDWRLWALLAAVAVACTLAAAISALATVARRLRRLT